MKKTLVIAALALLALQALPLYAQTGEGTVQVTILDDKNNPVEAPVYIKGTNRTRFMGGKTIPGTMVFSMKAGDYSFSSALAQRTGDYIDRYTSNEAHITVVEGDNVSVILKLKPIQDYAPAMAYAESHPGPMTAALASRINTLERN